MKKNKIIKHILKYKSIYTKLLCLPILLVLYYFIYKIYIPRINAFGCFDDCFNFMGGYFLLKGKHIYSDFFFNHQPLAAYLSFIIQYFTHPQSIFELVLRHRQFMIFFSFFFNILLILRYGIKSLIFAVLFEFSKFYIFGDRFLAEGIIVYPLIYMLGLVLFKLSNNKISRIDYLLSAIFAWFVIFSREPYVPLALFLYFLILWEKKYIQKITTSLVIFISLSAITILSLNIKEYFFNVITINYQVVLPNELKGQLFGGPLQMFFYPLFIFFNGPQNIFKFLLIGICILFLIFYIKLLIDKKYAHALIIFLALGLSNLKPVIPGKLFFESFHMIIWFSQFIFITLFLIFLNRKNPKLFIFSIFIIFIILGIFLNSPSYFAKEKIDQQAEFINNYGQSLQEGEVIRTLATKNADTLFLDGSDDIVYWQSQINSSYKYQWYTSVMPSFTKYNNARLDMFKSSPPDFYRSYGICQEATPSANTLPLFIKNDYVNILQDNRASCLYVRKEKLSSISEDQWKEALKWHYSKSKSM